MPGLHEMPDSAYGQHPAWDDDLDFEDMSRGHYDRLKSRFDTPEMEDERHHHALGQDEDSQYNWGPPPPSHDEPPEPPEIDTHYDPDHGREAGRTAGLQWHHDGLNAVAEGPAERYLIHAPVQDEIGRPGPGDQFLLHSMPTHGGDQSRWHYLSPHASLEEAQDAAEAAAHHPEHGAPWQDFAPEEHRTGAVLRQSEQWALHRFARGYTEAELEDTGHGHQHHDSIQYLKDTGLYGEDEDHPYKGVIGKPSPHGNGYDVVRVVE